MQQTPYDATDSTPTDPPPTDPSLSGDTPPGGDASPAEKAPRVDRVPARGRRRVLAIVGLGLLGLLVVGGGVGLFLYDKATAPDRSTPVVSADAFLHASLVERSVDRVSLYVCDAWPPDQALAQVSARLDPAVRVSWGGTSVRQGGAEADVTVRMTFSVSGTGLSQRSIETWRLAVVEEGDGWRVCSVDRD